MGGLFSDMSNTSRLWQDVKSNDKYEIFEFYPFFVRNKQNHKVLKEQPTNRGYVRYKLRKNNKPYLPLKHRLIAEQYIPNPDNLPEVNHINRIRDDNHLSNLEWVSKSQNCSRCGSYCGVKADYVERPTVLKRLLTYNQHTFENRPIYYNKDGLYYIHGTDCRSLHLDDNRNCYYIVNDDNKLVNVRLNKVFSQNGFYE
jgi:hypothetical protein